MKTADRLSLPGVHERALLRQEVRAFLEKHWPAAGAVERRDDARAVAGLWEGLVRMGMGSLGRGGEDGGLCESVVVMEELGRAAAPVHQLGAALANLVVGPSARDVAAASLLDRVRGGLARIAVSFGELEPDPQVGRSAARGAETLHGTLQFVDGAAVATDLLVATSVGFAVVDLKHPGATVTPVRALGANGWYEVTLQSAPAQTIAAAEDELETGRLVANLLLLARAHGAARRAFEMVTDYAKERRQFGQPIGQFQAIQHKLADCFIALEGVRLTVEHAAKSFDFGFEDWRYFARAAVAFGGSALRQVSLETQHTFGAAGYAEEHEAPRHFRRVHLDTVVLGGAREARAGLAAAMLDAEGARVPRYDLGDAGNAFREEVRAWLVVHWPAERKAAFDDRPLRDRVFDPSFALELGKTGWLGLNWPCEYSGQGRTPMEQLAFLEEMVRAEVPRIGAPVQASALMMYGTERQKAHYLPEILRGEAVHGMGYSEPESGSDLASLRTKAVLDGDHWVINGQKIWTTAWWAKYMFLAARTEPNANPPYAGISMFIVPMDTRGITVRPAMAMHEGSFANVFYENVRIPADSIVGPVNGGWKVLMDALARERGLVGASIVLKVMHGFELLCGEIRRAPALAHDAIVRDRIGALAAEIEVGRRLMIRCAELAVDGASPPEIAAMSKVFSSELMERCSEATLDLLGPRASLSYRARGALADGRFEQQLRDSLAWVISVGTNEIQRNLIAQRGLGLPR